jgi:hypothetical protein
MANLTSASNNNRVIYAMQGLAIGPMGSTGVIDSWGSSSADDDFTSTADLIVAHGVQSFEVTTTFNLEQIFELGRLSLYENYEEVPDVEASIEKFLDGYTLLYHMATPTATTPTLVGRVDSRCDVRLVVGLGTDTFIASGNNAVTELYSSGMYISSASYTLSTDGTFSESIGLVGNDKQWLVTDDNTVLVGSGGTIVNAFASTVFGTDSPDSPGDSVLRRQNVVDGSVGITLGSNTFKTVVPSFIEGAVAGATGVSTGGLATNCTYLNDNVILNSFSTSVDLSRDSINRLGQKLPYFRYVSFPVDVTTDIEVTATAGDNITASGEAKNLSNSSIQIVLDDSTVIQLGNSNKVTSVTYGGGDTGGGNATNTYSMTNSNDFVILHSGDPMATDAADYFTDWFA